MAEKFLSVFQGSNGNSNMTRAKKLADIYIRSNTNNAGKVTDPNVYQNAINNYLAPYADNIDIQKTVLGYQNTMKTLDASSKSQDSTVAYFQNKVLEGITLKSNAAISDPVNAAQYISSNLDTILMSVNQTIEENKAQNKSVDALETYKNQLGSFASAQRRLVSGFINGFPPTADGAPSMDGYGVYVRTNPADGSVVGGTVVPTAYVPKEFGDNTQRIETNQFIGDKSNPSAYIPVYLPAYKNQYGEMEAKLGNNTWTGTSGGILSGGAGNAINGNFDISNQDLYPIQPINLKSGQFGSAVVDKNGNKNYYWKGADGQVRVVDQKSLPDFLNDPTLKSGIEKAIPLGYDDIKGLGALQTYSASDVTSAVASIPPPPMEQPKSSFFSRATALAKDPSFNPIGGTVGSSIMNGISSFFGRKNKQSAPVTNAPVSSNGNYSSPDVVANGQQFFKQPQ